jgi:hypothetical protein
MCESGRRTNLYWVLNAERLCAVPANSAIKGEELMLPFFWPLFQEPMSTCRSCSVMR